MTAIHGVLSQVLVTGWRYTALMSCSNLFHLSEVTLDFLLNQLAQIMAGGGGWDTKKERKSKTSRTQLRKQWVHWPLCRVIIDDMDILSLSAMGYPVAVILGCQGMKKKKKKKTNPPKKPRLSGTRQTLCLALMGQMFTGQISQYISVILLEKSDFCQGSKCTNRP